ncbi:19723_t:CDS:2, partial [Dentiscutata erythropus]
MPSKQLSMTHAAKHQPKGVASSGGAQTGVGAIKSQYLVDNPRGDGVASSGGAQTGVGYCW